MVSGRQVSWRGPSAGWHEVQHGQGWSYNQPCTFTDWLESVCTFMPGAKTVFGFGFL